MLLHIKEFLPIIWHKHLSIPVITNKGMTGDTAFAFFSGTSFGMLICV